MSSFDDLAGLGGSLCLDLANPVDWRFSGRAIDRLKGYNDLLHWAAAMRSLSSGAFEALSAQAQRKPQAAHAVLVRTKKLRETSTRSAPRSRGANRIGWRIWLASAMSSRRFWARHAYS